METPPDERRSLTTRLASAAADSGVASILARAEPDAVHADDEDEPRCTASVRSGQRCRRPAAPNDDLCVGHIAMGGNAFVTMQAAR